MVIRYYINGDEISEPIGFDSFTETLKRTQHHGVVRSLSVQPLEFYGDAFDIVSLAYNTDIDTELLFEVFRQCDGEENVSLIFSGIIDLSTYEEKDCRCRCRVGEKSTTETIFNNRSETVVNVERLTTLDGDSLSAYSNINRLITVPAKGISIQAKSKTKTDTTSTVFSGTLTTKSYYIQPKMNVIINDLKNIVDTANNVVSTTLPDGNQFINVDSLFPVRTDAYFDIIIVNRDTRELTCQIWITNGVASQFLSSAFFAPAGETTTAQITIIDGNAYNSKNSIYLFVEEPVNRQEYDFDITFKEGTYVNYKYLDLRSATTANVSLIHETLSRTAEIISGLTVKSDWLSRADAEVNPRTSGYGGGSMKAIITGIKLRNGLLTDGTDPILQTSFKDLFESLTAIDNLGWSFEYDDDGVLDCVRVEPFDYFYQNTNVLTINNPAELLRTLDVNRIYSRLKIGYQKYADTGDVNSIDTFHTQRDYSTGLKVIDNELVRISKFVACPYAIEFTRRKALDIETNDWRYDEDIFIFELRRGTDDLYTIKQGMTDEDRTIINPATIYNAALSPSRNAIKHLMLMFPSLSTIADIHVTALNINTRATGRRTSQSGTLHADPADGGILSENDTLSRVEPIYTPEIIEFEYPISQSDWDVLNADRYGLITVNSVPCWLSEASRSPLTGITKFKLIPKNV